MNGDKVIIELSRPEALILSDLLFRWEDPRRSSDTIHLEHQAEKRVLWYILARLEPQLEDEARSPDYHILVEKAREAIAPADE